VSDPFERIQLLWIVKDLIGEQAANTDGTIVTVDSVYWTDDELTRLINDAYIEAAKFTKALEVIELISTTADQAAYTLPATVGQVFRVSYDNRKVYSTTKWEMDRQFHNWENETGYVSHYILTQQNNRTIRLYKAPEISGGLAIGSGEYGLVTSISDGENTYLFSNEYGVIEDTGGTGWDSDFIGEYGEVTISGGVDNNFEVWATKHPATLSGFTSRPELPYWSHMGIAFRAAAKALEKEGEQAQPALAEAYNKIAFDYLKLLKGFVANRSAESITQMGRGNQRQRRPEPWETPVEDN
jgi:hypothetical protein